jgi:hypothetical protein
MTTSPVPTTTSAPWPRTVSGTSVFKVYDHDGMAENTWFVSSKSEPGAFRLVQFHSTPKEGRWWTCSCPAGHDGFKRMGAPLYERTCRHIQSVAAAEMADGHAPRPIAPPAVSALVD